MYVIGTAGHVDHGKSSLVRRLTNIDPDRLAEEKARALTIDLGFAWFELNGEMVGIVDVPGHRDFVENMLAGVGGIDAVILVIAADEGVMPQTREHLAILDLLSIESGIIALSKVDLVDDPDWLELVKQDVREIVAETVLAQAPIVPVSAITGAGIDSLLNTLESTLAALPSRPAGGQPRIPVDRVFSMSGFGTVITGTLLGGSLNVGDEIELQPGDHRGRVRGLQSYKQTVETAQPGSRVAVNISGVDKHDVARGHVLTYLGRITPTRMIDVQFRHLPDADRPLKHNTEVKVFVGAAESLARVRLLNDETLAPGATGWLQLRLSDPLAVARGDRYILRYPSPPQTIGGGLVVEARPQRRWKRFQPHIIQHLETLLQGTPAERLAQAADGREPISWARLQEATDTDEQALAEALAQDLVVEVQPGSYLSAASYHNLLDEIVHTLHQFHTQEPLRLGMPREEMRSRLGVKAGTLNLLLDAVNIHIENNLLRLPDHVVRFTPEQQKRIDELTRYPAYTPPGMADAASIVGDRVLRALIDLGEYVQVKGDVILSRTAYEDMVAGTLDIIDSQGNVDARGLRDRFNTSRKYAIALLEHLDSQGVTRRVGDERVRGRTPWPV